MPNATCLNCGASEIDRPLLTLKFQGKEVYLCPQCMPIMIHKPQQLVEKLPGMKPWSGPVDHEH
jgi:hypothetical protein